MIKQKLSGLKYLLFILVLGLSFTGAECEKLFTNGGIDGSWELVKMEGDLQDVCLGEIAQFSGTTATLTCPGKTAITKTYTFSNNVLSYTTSGVSYNVEFKIQNGVDKMILSGQNIQRILTYDRLN